MVQKTPCWMASDVEGQEKQRLLHSKANILSFQGSTAPFAIQQGVFYTMWPYRAKCPLSYPKSGVINLLTIEAWFSYNCCNRQCNGLDRWKETQWSHTTIVAVVTLVSTRDLLFLVDHMKTSFYVYPPRKCCKKPGTTDRQIPHCISQPTNQKNWKSRCYHGLVRL